MSPSLGLNYIIALQGLYPSRSSIEPDDIGINALESDSYVGEISLFAGNFAPRGWAFCDGQLLSISSNTALFSLLGTTYGGDGRTTFALPDLRGRVALHEGRGAGLSDWRLGERGGAEDALLNLNHLASHKHTINPGPEAYGDLDGDWDIDRFDFNTFKGQLGMKAPPGVLASDIDNDGDVDLDDFAIIRDAFGFGVPAPPAAPLPAASIPLPEPTTLCLLLLGGVGIMARRRN